MSIGGTLANVSPRSFRVWQRDMDVYRKTWKTNFVPPLLEPIFYIIAFGLGLGSMIGELHYQGRTVGYLQFMSPGVVSVAILFWAFFETTYSSFVRMYYQKTFDAIIATPLVVEDVIAGELLWGATKAIIAAVIMLGVLTAFGLIAYPTGLIVLPIAIVGGLLFAASGLIATALVPSIDTFNFPIFLFVFPMFMFSGTFFPIEILPHWARIIAWTLPLTHIAYLVRGACFGWFPSWWVWNALYLVVLAPAAGVAALVLMKRRLIK
jgi:lipooligosaccharide transport system permease protein